MPKTEAVACNLNELDASNGDAHLKDRRNVGDSISRSSEGIPIRKKTSNYTISESGKKFKGRGTKVVCGFAGNSEAFRLFCFGSVLERPLEETSKQAVII